MRSGSVMKNGERYPQSNCIPPNGGCSLALEERTLPPGIAPDPSALAKKCSSTVASFAAMIANLRIPASGLQLVEFAIGVVFRLNILRVIDPSCHGATNYSDATRLAAVENRYSILTRNPTSLTLLPLSACSTYRANSSVVVMPLSFNS